MALPRSWSWVRRIQFFFRIGLAGRSGFVVIGPAAAGWIEAFRYARLVMKSRIQRFQHSTVVGGCVIAALRSRMLLVFLTGNGFLQVLPLFGSRRCRAEAGFTVAGIG